MITEKEFNDLSDLIEPAIKAYHEGRAAAENMKSMLNCPYDALTIERKAWMRGYYAVREEDSRAAQKQAIRSIYGSNFYFKLEEKKNK